MGAVIGLERESSMNEDTRGAVGGIRTFALVALLGALSGIFYTQKVDAMFLLVAIFVFVMVGLYYFLGTSLTKRTGITTEISVIYTFLIGFLATTDILPTQFVVALMVVVLLILSTKTKTKNLVHGMSHREIESFIIYAIVALVILPFLPNQPYYLTDIPFARTLLDSYHINLGAYSALEILNPYKLWLIVALVTGIDILGYVLNKIMGQSRGVLTASITGGFVSSTATTITLAGQSKRGSTLVNRLVGVAILANGASFIQIILLVAPINPLWLVYIFPTILIMTGASILVGIYYLRLKGGRKHSSEKTKEREIFSLSSAIKFALILIGIRLVTKISLLLFGQAGFLVSSVLASFAGLDAIIINIAELAGSGITVKVALLALIIVNGTNLLAKSFYSYLQGRRDFFNKFSWSMIVIILSSLVGYFIS